MAGGDGKAAANDTKGGAAAPPAQFQFAQKPEEKPGWEGFKQFLWNSETSEFLGRTGCSWFKIGLFYVIYYAFLAGFFMAMLVIFFQTLDDKVPKWLNTNGIIGGNPGVGFRPSPPDDKVESTLIFYRHGTANGNWKTWVDNLDDYLDDYKKIGAMKPKPSAKVVECSFKIKPGEGQICQVDAEKLMTHPCNADNKYGYRDGKPCILLKLNRIYGWKPEPYLNSTAIPDEAPKALKDYIKEKEASATESEMVGRSVWFSCEGENPADNENLGPIEYFPYPGVPDYYFPYTNQEDYLSPAVFVHLSEPKKGVLISIECKAWANNIKHDSMERMGSAHFELMID